jgi:hypothetical protein
MKTKQKKKHFLEALQELMESYTDEEPAEEPPDDFEEPEPPVVDASTAGPKRKRGRPRKERGAVSHPQPPPNMSATGSPKRNGIPPIELSRAEAKLFPEISRTGSEPGASSFPWGRFSGEDTEIAEGGFDLSTKEGILSKFGTHEAMLEVLANKFKEHERAILDLYGKITSFTGGRTTIGV